ncbi:BON domain-containing protein [Ideonella azotifigens]|uniref:BON domain-containing protein n=1 Tax=Ideonella azotifigens TaxID=513160 RepID=A0ABN1KI33_9BURK|nr:BON domain-containing protein [Ideonella azotifigens]MCD2344235.1 BON domain-containing protein [Ideonella azotifigens]
MKTDAQLKADITTELQWDPVINAAHVGVAAKDGVVTLTGHLETFAEKHAIERAVQRVAGVKAVAVELDVKLAPGHKRSDSEIAEAVESAFKWNVMIPADRIRVKVEKGWVSLTGEVDWQYQRSAAERAVRALIGVVGVSDGVTIKPSVAPSNITNRIRDALARHAEREAKNIEVMVSGAKVTLRGRVDSWAERAAAQGAAWAAPGISLVVNELTVGTHS